MTVRAAHIAFSNLGRYRYPLGAVSHEGADRADLGAAMIEVEHDRVALSAIDARMLDEICEDAAHERVATCCSARTLRTGRASDRALVPL